MTFREAICSFHTHCNVASFRVSSQSSKFLPLFLLYINFSVSAECTLFCLEHLFEVQDDPSRGKTSRWLLSDSSGSGWAATNSPSRMGEYSKSKSTEDFFTNDIGHLLKWNVLCNFGRDASMRPCVDAGASTRLRMLCE